MFTKQWIKYRDSIIDRDTDPIVACCTSRNTLVRTGVYSRFGPVTIVALLLTLVFIFAFQADNIVAKPWHLALIAIPILSQVYMNTSLVYGLMRWLKVPYAVAAPGALIGASNFFERAVATAIALFGPESGAALATVAGVLVKVPVLLYVCHFFNCPRHWFPKEAVA